MRRYQLEALMNSAQMNTATDEKAKRHLLTPAENMSTLGSTSRPMLASGDGIYVTTPEGRRLIDGPAGMWCTQIGYSRGEMADAIAKQAMSLSYNSPWYTTNSPAALLAERIARVTPGDLNRFFFTTGGSTAVDSALRFTEYFNNVLGRPMKKRIIVRKDGYHGSTYLTAACSGREGNWQNFDIHQDRIRFISSPNIRLANGLTEERFLDQLVTEFETTIMELGADTVAAFLAEPFLASGGVIIPPKGYHSRIKALCEKFDIIYISDEVVSAFGRCGEWFASEKTFGFVPDIITFAKGVTSGYVPLGGMAVSEKLISRVSGDSSKGGFFTNGYTWSGHAVSCAAALANMDLIEKENLLEHTRELAPYFQNQLRTLADLPGVVDVRSVGLVGCVECMTQQDSVIASDADKAFANRVDDICFDLGLIVRPIANMCVISPPLIITREQINDIISILRKGIKLAAEELL
ncbi:aminotransferase [Pseudomonas sp. Pseusp3]|uniref:aminotransferase n=1 Tax=Pseudomonas sp. Pseusp3 TaxID=3243029 RepID=UPI0039AEC93A